MKSEITREKPVCARNYLNMCDIYGDGNQFMYCNDTDCKYYLKPDFDYMEKQIESITHD